MINNTDLSNYIIIKENEYHDIESLKYKLVSSPSFIKQWCLIAHSLGFYGAYGDGTKKIGENMNLEKSGSDYILQGTLSPVELPGADPGFFVPRRVKITFSNFKLEFIPETISTKEPKITDLASEVVTSTRYINRDDTTATVTKSFTFSKSDTTSNYSSNSISNSVSLRYNYNIEVPGLTQEFEISYNFSQEHTFGQQKDETFTQENTDEFSRSVPPNSSIPIKVLAYKANIKVPYTALAKVMFNVTFQGQLLKPSTIYKDHSIFWYGNYASLTYTFGNDSLSAIEDLNKQYTNKNIPDSTPWNWNLLIASKKPYIQSILKSFSKEYVAEISGEFNKSTVTDVVIDAGKATPLQ
ncbi:aerolysin family beta-barrel pore-forming toxin [Clostridium tarantellae]|uniref:Aerolysin family beta-barrel pore-forming toxin n=1 Tax=Clostridium tarantellae TaxID=39493 RepID=A0A6I1MQ95_9CLOT|nr:aerolysin family beta-barrel pore-forming toxin [Clostridium tarantellae]MPQ44970.1 aerolysin family beta-barrel pore-forming toxin [Clostridium tarantellae]